MNVNKCDECMQFWQKLLEDLTRWIVKKVSKSNKIKCEANIIVTLKSNWQIQWNKWHSIFEVPFVHASSQSTLFPTEAWSPKKDFAYSVTTQSISTKPFSMLTLKRPFRPPQSANSPKNKPVSECPTDQCSSELHAT